MARFGKVAAVMLAVSVIPAAVRAEGGDEALNAATTNRVVGAIEHVLQDCRQFAPVYLPDCVGKALQNGASKISNNPAYWEAHVILTRLSRGLEQAVRRDRDESADRVRAGGYRVNAVMPGALPALAARTEQEIARAQEDFDRLSAREQTVFRPLRDLIVSRRVWP